MEIHFMQNYNQEHEEAFQLMDDFDDVQGEKEVRQFKFNKDSLGLLEIESDINTTEWQRTKLHPGIAKYLVKAGLRAPTQIQKQALRIRPDQSSVICAETGSGKSFAYLLPLVQDRLLQYKNVSQQVEQEIQWLVIVPTHELATQVQKQLQKVFGDLLKHFNLCAVLVGGMSEEKQLRFIGRKPAIVIVTPGRAARLFTQNELKNVRKVIIDEADRCLQPGQQSDDLKRLLIATKRQALCLVSATIGLPVQLSEAGGLLDKNTSDKHKKQQKLKIGHNNRFVGNSIKVISSSVIQTYQNVINYLGFSNLEINLVLPNIPNNGNVNASDVQSQGRANSSANDAESMQLINQSVQEIWHYCNDKYEKFKVLTYILLTHNCPTIVFCESGQQCKILCETYKLMGLPAVHLSGQQQQKQRYKAIEKLGSHEVLNENNQASKNENSENECTILFTTDLGSRGIDTAVKLVIQYTAPVSVSSHIHRVGRCARQQSISGQNNKIGVALSLISPQDDKQYKIIKEACYDNNFRDKVLGIENYNAKLENQLFVVAKCASALQDERSMFIKEVSMIKKAIQQENQRINMISGTDDGDQESQNTAYDVLLSILNDKQRRKQIKLGGLYDQLTNNKHGFSVDKYELDKRYKQKEREINALERQLKLQIYLHTQQSQKITFENQYDLHIIGQTLRYIEFPQLPKLELNFADEDTDDNDQEKPAQKLKKQVSKKEEDNSQILIQEPQIQQLVDINPSDINYNASGPKMSKKMRRQQDKLNKKQEFAKLRHSTENTVNFNEFQAIAKGIADEVDPDFMMFGPKEQRVKKMSNYKGKKKVQE